MLKLDNPWFMKRLGGRTRSTRGVTIVFKDGVGYDSAKLIASVKRLVGIR